MDFNSRWRGLLLIYNLKQIAFVSPDGNMVLLYIPVIGERGGTTYIKRFFCEITKQVLRKEKGLEYC